MDEVKNELIEIVDYLKEPEKYQKIGARPPKGVLLYGAPGSGKTLLARAVAGEAGVAFFSASGSEFMEMLVGMGAAKVRKLFEQAKAAGKAIIFIDEIDAIGKREERAILEDIRNRNKPSTKFSPRWMVLTKIQILLLLQLQIGLIPWIQHFLEQEGLIEKSLFPCQH